jgi:S-formylglutathione hydrolase
MGTLGLIVDVQCLDTNTESFSSQKGSFLGPAAKEGIAIVFTDTSPRGAGIEGEDDDLDFGTGMARD